MEIYEFTFKDGRVFRVLCENRNQTIRTLQVYHNNKHLIESFENVVSGIHTTKQFEQMEEELHFLV